MRLIFTLLLTMPLLMLSASAEIHHDAAALEKNPISSAQVLVLAGRYRQAVSLLKQVDPETAEEIDAMNFLLGSIYRGVGDPMKALDYLSEVGRSGQWSAAARLSMVEVLLDRGDLDAARNMLEALRAEMPGPRIDYLYALSYEVQGKSDRADALLEQSARANQDSDLPITNSARLMVRRGQLGSAIEVLENAHRKHPKSAHIAEELSLLLAQKKDYENAVRYARLSLTLHRDEGERLNAESLALRVEQWLNETKKVTGTKSAAKEKHSAPIARVEPKGEQRDALSPQPLPSREKIDLHPIRQAPEAGARNYPPHFSQFPFPSGSKIRGGSGIVVDRGRKVITNRHVIEGGNEVAVRNGLGDVSRARIIYVSDTDDLAVLSVDQAFSEERSFDLRRSRPPEAGSSVVVMGYPLWYLLGGATPSISNGVVAKATGFNEDPKMFQLTAKVNKGNSGGPVFDLNGNLVGITQGKLDTQSILRSDGFVPEDVNFAIPAYRLTELPGFASVIPTSTADPVSPSMQPQEIYRAMMGKVVMVAVKVD